MRAYEHELPWDVLRERLRLLDDACHTFDYEKVLALLGSVVQEYAAPRWPVKFPHLWSLQNPPP
jgi:hypothetical protein